MTDHITRLGGAAAAAVQAELEDWEREDPNLLNIPELLYRQCEKYPLPSHVPTKEEIDAYFEKQKMLWQCFYDDYSDFLDLLESEDPLPPETEDHDDLTGQLLEAVLNFFREEKVKIENFFQQFREDQSIWQEEDLQAVFSDETKAQVLKWKASLKQFLETYMEIRKFIPPGTMEENQETEEMKNQRQQLARLPKLVALLEETVGMLNLEEDDDEWEDV